MPKAIPRPNDPSIPIRLPMNSSPFMGIHGKIINFPSNFHQHSSLNHPPMGIHEKIGSSSTSKLMIHHGTWWRQGLRHQVQQGTAHRQPRLVLRQLQGAVKAADFRGISPVDMMEILEWNGKFMGFNWSLLDLNGILVDLRRPSYCISWDLRDILRI